jgi:hypothetical protein
VNNVQKKTVKGLAAAVLIVFGLLCLANIVDVEGASYATIQFYQTSEPTVKSYNFPGTSASPTILPPGNFVPEVLVEMDTDTLVDLFASKCTIDGNNWAVYWDHSKAPGRVYTGSSLITAGQKYHITFNIVFSRISSGSTTTLTVDGYVQGGSVSGTWYLNQYNLNALSQYEVLQIPYGAVTLKFVASSGGGYVDKACFKIWKHVLGRDVTAYEPYPPDWTITLTEVTVDSTWSSSWTPPNPGIYVMYGIITMSGKDYRQLSVVPTLDGSNGWFGVNQVVGLFSIAIGIVVAAKK